MINCLDVNKLIVLWKLYSDDDYGDDDEFKIATHAVCILTVMCWGSLYSINLKDASHAMCII